MAEARDLTTLLNHRRLNIHSQDLKIDFTLDLPMVNRISKHFKREVAGTRCAQGKMPFLKTPSWMDVAPWAEHWIKMVLDGSVWYCMVFDGTRWYCLVLLGIQ